MSFKDMLAKSKLKKDFDKAKKVKDEQVPDGTYDACLVEKDFGKGQNGNPRALLKYKVLRGEFKGRTISQMFSFEPFKGSYNGKTINITAQDKFEQMCKQIQRLKIDTDCDPDEIEEQLEELIEEGTTVVLQAKTNKKGFCNITISKIVEDESAEDDDDEEEVEDDDEDDVDDEDDAEEEDEDAEEDEEDDEEEEEDDDEEDGDYEPAKGDDVEYKLGGKKATSWVVTSVNKSKQTVSLKREKDGKVQKNVPWDQLLV